MDALEAPLEVARQVGIVGVVAAAALVWLAVRHPVGHSRERPLPAAGAVMAAAALVGIGAADEAESVTAGLVVGVAAAATGALVWAWRDLDWWARPLLLLPGAALAVDAAQTTVRASVVSSTIVAAAVLSVLVGETDRIHARSAAAPPLLAMSMLGVYATIPETREILPVLVVAVPIALVGGPLRLARLGAPGAAATVVLLTAIVVQGGEARPASIVGGLASFGVLALEPVARAVVRSPRAAPDRWRSRRMLALVAVHSVVILVGGRIAGLRQSLAAATAIVAVVSGVALVALAVLARDVDRDDEDG